MGARIGVVGLGRIGSYHARNLLTLNGVDALVVTDVDARRTSDVASELDVESAADPDALLASGIDGVLIAAPSSSHAELIEAAVRLDIPTFCEKPVADSIESSVRVLATAEQTSVPVQIGFQRRFDPSFVAAYDAVRSGELGWIHTLRSTTLDPRSPRRSRTSNTQAASSATARSTTSTSYGGSAAAKSPLFLPPVESG